MTKELQTNPQAPEQVNELDKLRLDMALIMRIATDFVDLFGLLDETKEKIRQEILEGKEDPLPAILQQIVQIATVDAVMAKMSKRKREELEAKFEFLGYLGSIIGKYPPAPKTVYHDLKAAKQTPA